MNLLCLYVYEKGTLQIFDFFTTRGRKRLRAINKISLLPIIISVAVDNRLFLIRALKV